MMNEKERTQEKNNDSYTSRSTNAKKLKFYCTLPNKMLHIKLINGEFRNCTIKEELSDGIWKVIERKLGEMHLFEDDIKDNGIEEYAQLNNDSFNDQ